MRNNGIPEFRTTQDIWDEKFSCTKVPRGNANCGSDIRINRKTQEIFQNFPIKSLCTLI